MNGRISKFFAIVCLLLSATVSAQWAVLPTGEIDAKTVRIQSKVEALYERGDYERAHFIYTNELAGLGDKYAQYMSGYMYLMGQGVPEDPVRASAWYRIAAERKAREFISVRDQLMETLTAEERARSDALYLDLRKEYSDIVIVMNLLVARLEDFRSSTTGSRVAGQSSAVMIVDPKSGVPMSADHFKSRIRQNLQTRLDFITSRLDIEPLDANLSDQQVAALWERIHDYLAVVDDESDAYVNQP